MKTKKDFLRKIAKAQKKITSIAADLESLKADFQKICLEFETAKLRLPKVQSSIPNPQAENQSVTWCFSKPLNLKMQMESTPVEYILPQRKSLTRAERMILTRLEGFMNNNEISSIADFLEKIEHAKFRRNFGKKCRAMLEASVLHHQIKVILPRC